MDLINKSSWNEARMKLRLGRQVGCMSLPRAVKATEGEALAANLQRGRVTPVIVPAPHTKKASGVRSGCSRLVLGIYRVVHQPEVGDAVVGLVAIDVVDLLARPLTQRVQPSQLVSKIQGAAKIDDDVALLRYRAGARADHSRLGLLCRPSEVTCLRRILKPLTELREGNGWVGVFHWRYSWLGVLCGRSLRAHNWSAALGHILGAADVGAKPDADDQRAHEMEKDVGHGSVLSEVARCGIESVRSPLKRVAGKLCNQGKQAEEEAQEVADVAHSGLGFLAPSHALIRMGKHFRHRHIVSGEVGNFRHVGNWYPSAAPLRYSGWRYLEFFRDPGRTPRLRIDPCVQVHGLQFSPS